MINNITEILFKNAEKFPDKIAIIHKNKKINYGGLAADVKDYACYFLEKGLKKGDNVLIFVPMSIELYKILCSIFHIGATAVFIDAWADRKRLQDALSIVHCKAFIGCAKAFVLKLLSSKVAAINLNFMTGFNKFKPKTSAIAGLPNNISGEDTALITFTTGSTGKPKAAKRTHDFLLNQHYILKKHMEPKQDDIDLTTLPIFVLNNLACGTTSVIPDFNPAKPANINPQKISAEIKKYKINTSAGSPKFYEKLTQSKEQVNLERIFTGGAPVFPKLAKKLEDFFKNTKIEILYGSTEAEPISSISSSELLNYDTSPNSGLLVGNPSDINLKIIKYVNEPVKDFESLWLKNGETGEICVEGKHVLKEYYNSDEAQNFAKIKYKGQIWHRTGDAGYLDEQGRLFLMGRAKNKFEHNGKEYYVFPFENLLLENESIEIGTILKHNDKICIVAELKGGFKDTKIDNIPYDRMIFLKKIPRDPRHNSKIDYDKLKSMLP